MEQAPSTDTTAVHDDTVAASILTYFANVMSISDINEIKTLQEDTYEYALFHHHVRLKKTVSLRQTIAEFNNISGGIYAETQQELMSYTAMLVEMRITLMRTHERIK